MYVNNKLLFFENKDLSNFKTYFKIVSDIGKIFLKSVKIFKSIIVTNKIIFGWKKKNNEKNKSF